MDQFVSLYCASISLSFNLYFIVTFSYTRRDCERIFLKLVVETFLAFRLISASTKTPFTSVIIVSKCLNLTFFGSFLSCHLYIIILYFIIITGH